MRVGALLLLAAVVLFSTSGIAAAADNTAPMPEAGVDQTVPVNSTVYLDGTASRDPDGEITNVSWTIETPSGGTISPDCENCNRTEFDATALGQYTVTLTVTDDDGATRSDTLYVTTTNESGPDVSVSGPTATASGSNATFTANVSAEEASLQTLTWLVNGSVVERDSLNGSAANRSFTHSFDETGTPSVRAVAYDTLGNRGSATHRVSVGSVGGGDGVIGTGSYDPECPNQGCGADMRYTLENGEKIIADGDNDGKVKTYIDGQLTAIDTDAPSVKERPGSGYTIEDGADNVDEKHRTDMFINDEGNAVEEPDAPGFGGDSDLPGFGGDSALPGLGGDSDLPGFGGDSALPGLGGDSALPGLGDGKSDSSDDSGKSDSSDDSGKSDSSDDSGKSDSSDDSGKSDSSDDSGKSDSSDDGGKSDSSDDGGKSDSSDDGGKSDSSDDGNSDDGGGFGDGGIFDPLV
ncbi:MULTISPECIES: PKD domain-containing protein [Haloarcula]|uniref:PKD domain-containing protein n=1 Tax=Haloarcula TaxID=2237 RepID=UPI0023E7C1BB|nr:PKD domain-containing protein [Halomicroarcula sp. SHR3]